MRLFLELWQRATRRAQREARSGLAWLVAASASTYPQLEDATSLILRKLEFGDAGFLQQLLELSPWHADLIGLLAGQAIDHRFDLLGSGLVEVRRGMTCKGFEGTVYPAEPAPIIDAHGRWLERLINSQNLPASKAIWSLVGTGYTPIDWQLDFKSGFRWRESTWHGRIRFGHTPGADVKVPWELARLQHLPVLAMACIYSGRGYGTLPLPAQVYADEVRNQLLDFIATNPPGYGVNWVCAMDVGIRVANMLFAYEMLRSAGVGFEPDFDRVFAASVLAHARHIARNLEWTSVYRGNHYLADLAGLLFAASYLPSSSETDSWLSFSVDEMLKEIESQFHADGSNIEASVCYHRLSGEIVLWALALMANLPAGKRAALARPSIWEGPVPPRRAVPARTNPASSASIGFAPIAMAERLAAMADLTTSITRPDGLVVQFGDNDSGRFILVGPPEQNAAMGNPQHPAWSLDHGWLVSGINTLLGQPPRNAMDLILHEFAGKPVGGSPIAASPSGTVGDESVWRTWLATCRSVPTGSVWRHTYRAASGLLEGLSLVGFRGMGCYVARSPRLFLAIRCGEVGIGGLGAHDHCDQLAIELVVDGQTLARDPGTFVYTASPNLRNRYRSVRAHHAPRHSDMEPTDLSAGIFDLRGAAAGECLYFGARGFVGRHQGYGFDIYRLIRFDNDCIEVIDFSPDGHAVGDPTPGPIAFSQGYGRTCYEAK